MRYAFQKQWVTRYVRSDSDMPVSDRAASDESDLGAHVLARDDTKPAPRSYMRWLFLLAVLIWCGIPLSPNRVDGDLWGHIQYGRDTLQHGLAPIATYTYTADRRPWINHEVLSEILFARLVDQIGARSLLVGKLMLGGVVLGLIIWRANRQRVSAIVLALTLTVVAVQLSMYWSMRPQVFSFTLFAVLLVLLDASFPGWAGGWRLALSKRAAGPSPTACASVFPYRFPRLTWTLPVLFAVWANLHGGFLAGLVVMAVTFFGRGVEACLDDHHRAALWLRRVAPLVALTLLATCLNPYGPRLHLWLVRALGIPRPEVWEWQPPELFTPSAMMLWVLLVMILVALFGSRRPHDFTALLVLAAIACQALRHQRHVPFLSIFAGLWMPVHLDSALRYWLPQNARALAALWQSVVVRRTAIGVLTALCVLNGLTVLRRLERVQVQRSRYPVSAAAFIADQGLSGRMVVTGEWAQYVLATLGQRDEQDRPGIQVAFDGRFRTCYPQSVIDMFFDFSRGTDNGLRRYRSPHSPPPDPTRILQYRDPDLVLIDRGERHAVNVMQTQSRDWALLYQDSLAQLWGRRSVYDHQDSPRFLQPDQRLITEVRQDGAVPWPGHSPRMVHQHEQLADQYAGSNDSPRPSWEP